MDLRETQLRTPPQSAQVDQHQDTISSTLPAIETSHALPPPIEASATQTADSHDLPPEPTAKETTKAGISAPVNPAIAAHLTSKIPDVDEKAHDIPQPDATRVEDSAHKPRTSDDAVEEVKAAEKSRPQSPAQLKLFPKRLPVRLIVKSMETGSNSGGSTPTEGPPQNTSIGTRAMTPPPPLAAPAVDQGIEKQITAEASKVPLPVTSPLDKPHPLPVSSMKSVSIRSSGTEPATATSGGDTNGKTTASDSNGKTASIFADATKRLVAAKGGPSEESAVVEDSSLSGASSQEKQSLSKPPSTNDQSTVQNAAAPESHIADTTDKTPGAHVPEESSSALVPLALAPEPQTSDDSKVEKIPPPPESPDSIDIDDLHLPESSSNSKLPEAINHTILEMPHPYLSEPSEPPQSPLPEIPKAKTPEPPKPEPHVTQDSNPRLSRRPSAEIPASQKRESRAGRSSPLARSTTPDIITRRTSKDRLARSPTPSAGSTSAFPSRQLSLKLPVNPSNSFSQSGRISPSGRSPTPDILARRPSQEYLSRSYTPGLGDRESVSSRISLNVPIYPRNSLHRTPSYVRSPTPDTLARMSYRERHNTSPAPTDPLDFLAALASQERLVLELKEEQEQAELDLENLKKEWAAQDPYKKQDALRQVEELLLGQAQPSRHSSLKEAERKVEEPEDIPQPRHSPPSDPLPSGEVKTRQRKVFQGGDMRPLSLLSPNEPSPRPTSRATSPNSRNRNRIEDAEAQIEEKEDKLPFTTQVSTRPTVPEPESEAETEPDMEAEMEPEGKERSDALSIIQEEASTKSVKHDSMPPMPTDEDFMRNSLHLASDLREGLENFLENLKNANGSDKELISTASDSSRSSSPPEQLRKKKSRKNASGQEKEEHPRSPTPELKKSNSLIKTTLVKGDGDRHHSSIIDLDNAFFDSDVWNPSVKSPVLLSPKLSPHLSPKLSPRLSPKLSPNLSPKLSPKREETSSAASRKPARRYLNIESEEDLPLKEVAGSRQQQPRKESPTSSNETASTRRGSASTERSNPRSSTTSTHHEENVKRASSPLLVEAGPSESPPSSKMPSVRTDTPTIAAVKKESGLGSTTLTQTLAAPTSAPTSRNTPPTKPLRSPSPAPDSSITGIYKPGAAALNDSLSSNPTQDSEITPTPKEEIIPRLLPPRGHQPPSPSKFSMDMAPMKRRASDLMLKMERNMGSRRLSGSKKEKEKEKEKQIRQIQSAPRLSSPENEKETATQDPNVIPPPPSPSEEASRVNSLLSPRQMGPSSPRQTEPYSPLPNALAISPPSPLPPKIGRDSATIGRVSITSNATSRKDKDLPPLPPTSENPSQGKATTVKPRASFAASKGVSAFDATSTTKRKGFRWSSLRRLTPARFGRKFRRFSRAKRRLVGKNSNTVA